MKRREFMKASTVAPVAFIGAPDILGSSNVLSPPVASGTNLTGFTVPDQAVQSGGHNNPEWHIKYAGDGEDAEQNRENVFQWADAADDREVVYEDSGSGWVAIRASPDDVGVTFLDRVLNNGLQSRDYVETIDLVLNVSRVEPVDDLFSADDFDPGFSRLERVQASLEDYSDSGLAFDDDAEEFDMESVREVVDTNGEDAEQYDGTGVTVGVIDTGLNVHSNINEREDGEWNVVAGKSFISGEEIDLETEDFEAIEDANGHGTFVASEIAHVDDGVSSGADLIIAKALDEDGEGSTKQIVDAITWCSEQGADVLCMSLGSPVYSEAMAHEVEHVLDEHDVKAICVAAGNDRFATRWINSPADTPDHAIGVGATTGDTPEDAQSAYFSNVGPDDGLNNLSMGETRGSMPLVGAPGMEIQTEVADDRGVLDVETLSGTSMAAPIVAGVIAVYLEHDSSEDPEEIRELVARTAVPIPKAAKTEVGHGMINTQTLISDTEPDSTQTEQMESEAAVRDATHRRTGGGWF